MHWVLQDNIFNEHGFNAMVDTLRRFEIPFSEHKVIPFIGQIEPDVNPEGKVVCMGSYSMRHLARERAWYPGVWDLDQQHFLVQLENWGHHMLNHDCSVVEFQHAKIPLSRAFVRPIEDTKVFAGTVFDQENFEWWRHRICDLNEHPNGTTLASNTLVQVCSLRKIWSEYRFWVVRGKIVTSSLYKMGNKVRYENGAPEDVTEFVEDRIAEWEPHDAFVIDAADTPEGIKIVEINTLNSSGYYDADIQKLVMAIEESFG